MDLYTIKPKFMNLINKLELARRIYTKVAGRISDEFLAEQFKMLSLRKEIFIKEISRLYNFDYEQHTLDLKDKMKVEWEGIGIELNDLILRRNEHTLMEYCIHREKQILGVYREIINHGSFSDLFSILARNQMEETLGILDELSRSSIPYEEREENRK